MELAFVFFLTTLCYIQFELSMGHQENDIPTVGELDKTVSILEDEVDNLQLEVNKTNFETEKMNRTLLDIEAALLNGKCKFLS